MLNVTQVAATAALDQFCAIFLLAFTSFYQHNFHVGIFIRFCVLNSSFRFYSIILSFFYQIESNSKIKTTKPLKRKQVQNCNAIDFCSLICCFFVLLVSYSTWFRWHQQMTKIKIITAFCDKSTTDIFFLSFFTQLVRTIVSSKSANVKQ